MVSFGPTALRIVLGAVFVAHGAQKLFGVWGGAGLSGTAAYFAQLGFAPAFPLAMVVAIVELAGGLLLLPGAFTVPASAALLISVAMAIWKVHLPYGFFLNWTNAPGVGHGYEYNLVIAAALVSLILTGPGALSLDRHRRRDADTDAAGRTRLRSGQA